MKFYVDMRVSLCVHVYVSVGPTEFKEDIGLLGAGAKGSCEPPCELSEPRLVPSRAESALHCLAASPVPSSLFQSEQENVGYENSFGRPFIHESIIMFLNDPCDLCL